MLAQYKLFLSGPTAGHAYFNLGAFEEARDALQRHGFDVVYSTEMYRDHGFDPRETLDRNLRAICHWSEGMAVLPYWNHSVETRAQVAVARALHLPIHSVHEWIEHHPHVETIAGDIRVAHTVDGV
jgi:hypothetical protein